MPRVVPNRAPALAVLAVLVLTVAGCSSSAKDTRATAPVPTVTQTATVSAAPPATGASAPGSSTAPATSPATSSGPGLCTPTVMTFAVSQNDGAAGSVYFAVHATNASKSPCVTTGFPGMAFLNAGGNQILQADRDDPSTATTITVAPGEEVTAEVKASDGAGENRICPSSPAFLLTLPDNTDSTKINHTTPACSVSVSAFVKGAGT